MSSKVLIGGSAIGAFILAQALVSSILADIGLTILACGVGVGIGFLLAKK